MKDCKKIHPLLSLYIEEQLLPSERKQVEKHLDACDTARNELEHFRKLLEGLRKMPEPPVPADLHSKIMAKLGHVPAPSPLRHIFWGPPAWALTAAAVLVFILLNQYPDWRETLRVRPSKPTTTFAPEMGPSASQNQPVKPSAEAPLPRLTAKKKEPANKGYADLMLKKELPEKNLAETSKAAGLAAPAPAEEKVAAAPPPSAPMASQAVQPEVETAGNAEPQKKAVAKMAEAPPAAPSMNQSLQSLTYSREQPVTVWNGNGGPSTVESQELVTDTETFQKYWQVSHPSEAPPVVDFTTEAVVVLMAGEKPTAGYSIHISRLEEKADQLVIYYRVESPAVNAVVAQILTHPWAIQIIPKPFKPVTFVRDNP